MTSGWIQLHRQAMHNGWLQNHRLWAFWCYCLMKASHREHKMKVGFQEIVLKPGQFIFGRRQAAEDLNMTEWQIRACLDFLKKAGNLTIKTTNRFSIITIVNWGIYQSYESENRQQIHQQTASKPPQTIREQGKKEITPEVVSSLRERYTDRELIDRCFDAIRFTRKTGRVADSVLVAQLRKWERYPVDQVQAGIRTYLQKDYAGEGKDENYLYGIIRKQTGKGSKGRNWQDDLPDL